MSGQSRNARPNAGQAAGGNSIGPSNESSSGNATDAPAEPDQNDIAPIITGRHIWAARRATSGPPGTPIPPLVPYEDLPFPKSDRAQLPPCTVRWQFVGRFSLNREEQIACGSFHIQVRRYFTQKGIINAKLTVTFPRGVGRGRFVDITTDAAHLPTLSEVPLVFNGTGLQRHLIGSILPKTAMVVEIAGFSTAVDLTTTACLITHGLQPFAQVHDIWMQQISFPDDPEPQDFNKLAALVTTTAKGPEGGVDPADVHAIPGFIKINGKDCKLSYVGRLDWCTTCGSSSQIFHGFDNCPRRRCYRCGETGHSAFLCTTDLPSREADDAMATDQAAAEAKGGLELDYGQA
ncbi:hypothetical protein NDA16_000712 [Ustilago loliicola]|nr:hypothetical protein NDA16_000712 [Ustilago loliicola]